MSGRLLRSICTAAMAAATMVAAVPACPAAAVPVDPPPVSEPSGGSRQAVVEPDPELEAEPVPELESDLAPESDPGLEADTGEGAEEESGAPGAPAGSVSRLLGRLQSLYQQTEAATESYNATAESLAQQLARTKQLHTGLAAARNSLARSRDELGRLAREQYQGHSDFSSYARLLLAPDPEHALDQRHLMARAARARAATVARLEGAEKRAHALAVAARKALDRQQQLAARQKKQRDTVRARLAEVEELLASLSREQIAELTERERITTAGAQSELVGSGVLDGSRTPSEQGGEALRYAMRQVGKPYVWGAEGPESFDCSGLTSQAWASAGRTIPRTSQEQWRTLPKVPLAELRPGDLVIYFPEATHVAIYLGGGMVVQAPRPGARVKVSPIAANPLLGAVRPDPSAEPLPSYTPPPLPEGATDGADEGFDEESVTG